MPAPAGRRRPPAAPADAPLDLGRVSRVLVQPLDAIVPLVTVADLAAFVGPIPDAATEGLQVLLDGIVSALEAALHRPVAVARFVETSRTDWSGRVVLAQTPVVAIESVSVNGVLQPGLTDPREGWWGPGAVVTTTYTAGLAGRYGPALRLAVLGKALPFTRGVLARLAAPEASPAAGSAPIPGPIPGVKAFTVEGLNVNYATPEETASAVLAAAASEAASLVWTPAELAALGVHRRPVVA
jgi:hypothetical protein